MKCVDVLPVSHASDLFEHQLFKHSVRQRGSWDDGEDQEEGGDGGGGGDGGNGLPHCVFLLAVDG